MRLWGSIEKRHGLETDYEPPSEEPDEPEKPAFCIECGAPLAAGAKFCHACGHEATTAARAAPAGKAASSQPTRRGGAGHMRLIGAGIVIAFVITLVAASSSHKSSPTSAPPAGSAESQNSSPQTEAREYIQQKGHVINLGRVDYEHVAALVALAGKAGNESGLVMNELAKVAQESHDQIDGFREELFKTGGDQKLGEATLQLSEGANELKNSMGALVAYTGNPNPATLAHFTVQLDAAQSKWNQGVDGVWGIAHEHGALRLEAAHGPAAAKAAESVEGQPDIGAPRRECEAEGKHWNTSAEACE
jgi:hypothetical protein